jgi:ABC-type phosphate transport system substrate-binding protein
MIAGAVLAAALATGALAGGAQFLPAFGVRVCATTMTDQIANAIVGAYSQQHGAWPYHFAVTRPGDLACDVRFFTASGRHTESVIARDAVVAVVNPQNAIARLDALQARAVLTGKITDWTQLGGHPGPIAAAVPDDGSDEAHEVAERVMAGQPLAPKVTRTRSAADIVRWVSSPSGAGAMGFVPFSAALPAKVLALRGSPPASTLSIADERYPMTVRILASSDFRTPSHPAAALIAFARSAGAADLVGHSVPAPKSAPQ